MVEAEILLIHGSDHFPISLTIQEDNSLDRCRFKFNAMWLRVDGFKELVEQWWKNAPNYEGNKAFIMFKKLQYIKGKLKV